MRSLKLILKIFIALVLLAIIIIIGSLVFVKPNNFKSIIEENASHALNRPVKINGDIQWSFYPMAGFSLQDVEVKNLAPFNDQNFVTAKKVYLSLSLLPLLTHKVDVNKIDLDQAHINLIENAQGQNNWSTPSTASETHQSTSDTTKDSNNFDINIAKIVIDNSEINFIEQSPQGNTKTSFKDIHLEANDFSFEQPFMLRTSFSYQSEKKSLATDVSLKTSVLLDKDHIELQKTVAKLKVFLKNETHYQNMKLNALTIQLDKNNNGIYINDAILNTPYGFLKLDMQGIKGQYKGSIVADKLTLHKLLDKIDPNYLKEIDQRRLENIAAIFDFTLSDHRFEINNLLATFDKSKLNGSFSLHYPNNVLTDIEYNLQLDGINLNNYLIKSNTQPIHQAATKITPQPNVTTNQPVLAIAGLREIAIQGQLKIGELTYQKVTLSNISLVQSAKQGIFTFSPLHIDLFGGNYEGNIVINMQGDTPKWSFNERINHIYIYAQKARGTLTLQGQMQTKGRDPRTMLKNLNGIVFVDVTNGEYFGFDANYWWDVGQSLLEHQKMPESKPGESTKFKQLTASFDINNGIAENDDFILKSRSFYMTGKGSIDLVDDYLNYQVTLSQSENEQGIPLQLKGPFEEIKVSVDSNFVKRLTIKSLGKKLKLIHENR